MKKKITKKLRQRKQRIQYRLREIKWKEQNKPMVEHRSGQPEGYPYVFVPSARYDHIQQNLT